MKIIMDLEKETIDDLNLAIKKIQEEIEKRKTTITKTSENHSDKINLTEVLLKNKESMLRNPLKKD